MGIKDVAAVNAAYIHVGVSAAASRVCMTESTPPPPPNAVRHMNVGILSSNHGHHVPSGDAFLP